MELSLNRNFTFGLALFVADILVPVLTLSRGWAIKNCLHAGFLRSGFVSWPLGPRLTVTQGLTFCHNRKKNTHGWACRDSRPLPIHQAGFLPSDAALIGQHIGLTLTSFLL